MSTAVDIAVPLGVAVIAGAFGFLPTWYTGREQRREQQRAFERESAEAFTRRLGGAMDAVRYALGSSERGEDDARAIDNANWLVGETAAELPAARLRLSPGAGAHAKEAVDELREAADAIGGRNPSIERARDAYARAAEAEQTFIGSLTHAIDSGDNA
jgi:hypothetical protein